MKSIVIIILAADSNKAVIIFPSLHKLNDIINKLWVANAPSIMFKKIKVAIFGQTKFYDAH